MGKTKEMGGWLRATRLASISAVCLLVASAYAAGFDGKTLVTNDWFAASFTSLTADTAISQGDTTGITLGAGSWSSVPASATALIVADADAGGEATLLSIDVDTEEPLSFSPAPFSITSGYETVSVDIKTDPVYELPTLGSGVQGAFLIYMDSTEALSLQGYTDSGWTTLLGATASDLTNTWLTVYTDFATVSGVRYVRYSILPTNGDLTVLHDSENNTWLPAATSSKTTLESVSFTGTGKIRTFSGKELLEPVATYNGVNYGTVAAAIAAAEEGGTVTLTTTAYNESISITKDVSIDLNSNPLNCDSFNISGGTTLTVINTGNKQIKAPAFTGGGSIVATKGLRLCPTDATATSSLASITVTGDLSFDSGSTGTFNVTGDVTVSGTLTARDMAIAITGDLTAGAIAASGSTLPLGDGAADTTVTPQDTRLTVGGTITGSFVAGSGIVEYDGAMTINADSDGAFAGAILGGDVTKTGSGTLSLVGTNVIDGALNIEAGTVKLLNPYDIGTITFDFDASDENTFNTENDVFTSWDSSSSDGTKLILGGDSFIAPERALMEGAFGGTRYVVKSDKMRLKASGSITVPLTTFIMWRTAGWNNSGTAIFGDNDYTSWSFNRRNTWAYYQWRNYDLRNSQYNAFSNGQSGTPYLTNTDQLLSICGRHWMRYTTGTPYFGPGVNSTVAYAEILGFAKAFTLEERKAMEAYLMNKWGVGNVGAYATLPATTEVALSNNAVLDLGGFTQTLKSVSGSGVISNGTLTVTDAISVGVGESLVIPYGSTYTLAGDGTYAVEDSVGGIVTITHLAADIDGIPYDTVQGAVDAYESGTLTIYESAELSLTEALEITGVVVEAGVELTFAETVPFTSSYADGTITCVRNVSTFVYTGPETFTVAAANFTVGGKTASVVPEATDTIQFDTDATIDVTAASYQFAAVVVNANVTLNGDGSHYLYSDSISGAGKLSLGNAARVASYSGAATISCELEVNASSSNPAYLHVADGGREITLTGVLSGSGYLKCTKKRNVSSSYSGNTFKCSDTSGFTGTIEMEHPGGNDVGRNLITFWPTCDLSGATVIVGNYSGGRGRIIDGQSNNAVYKFGSFSGYVSPSAANISDDTHPTIEIGALGKDDTVTGNWMPHPSRNPTIRKVGTGTFTTSASSAYKYDICNGMVALATELAFPQETITFTGNGFLDVTTNEYDFAAKLVNSTEAPIGLFVTNNLTIGEIPASNTKGLTKRGSGTLTLSAAPLYTGATTVEEGTLVVEAGEAWSNYTLGANTKVTVEGTTYTFTALTAEELPTQDAEDENQLDVPAWMSGKSAAYNIAPGQRLDCSALADSSGIKATVSTTVGGETVDMTSYYTSASLGVVNGSVTPQLDKAEVGVDMGKTDEGVDTPVTFTDTNPTFKLKNSVKKGLYYGVGTISDPTAENPSVTILAETQADSDGQEISLTVPSPDFSSGNVIYYKLSVSDTAQTTP